MSNEGFQRFIQAAKRDRKLNDEFTAAVSAIARKSGFNVQPADIRDFLDNLPAERAEDLPRRIVDPTVTTQAMGEEDDKGRPSVTLAIGEEDKPRATTMAVGEEGGKPAPVPPMTVTSMAIGEEDKKGGKDGLNQRDEDRARDFDDMYGDQPTATTMALGEEDKKPAPAPRPDRGVTTLAMGEEGKKPRPPGPQ